jgi:hypothetical protein
MGGGDWGFWLWEGQNAQIGGSCSTNLGKRSALESASVKAATDCVAAAALNNSNIVKLYQQNRLKEVTDWIVLKSDACDNPAEGWVCRKFVQPLTSRGRRLQ